MSAPSEICSRSLSRKIRAYLNREVYPQLPVKPHELPEVCQINPTLDIYAAQERSKERLTVSDWRCNLCKKRFKSEFYLDRHMDNKHVDHLVINNGSSVCLADLCPIFGCSSKRVLYDGSHRKGFNMDEACTPDQVERDKYRCEVMMKRCFGELEGGLQLQTQFQKKICGRLQCVHGRLQGTIEETELMQAPIAWWLMQVLAVLLVLTFLGIYVLAVGIHLPSFLGGRSAMRPQFPSFMRRGRKKRE